MTTTAVSDVRDSAIKKGLIWSPEHGRIAFTVPGMAEFIRRQPTARHLTNPRTDDGIARVPR